MGNIHKALLQHTTVSKKGTYEMFWVANWTSCFFFSWNIILTWKKSWHTNMITQIWLPAYLANFFFKMNEERLSLQGKQLTVLVANYKIWAFKQKLNFWETYSPPWTWWVFQYQDFPNTRRLFLMGVDINECDFL